MNPYGQFPRSVDERSERVPKRVRVWTAPRTVYWASDRVRPRWAFVVRVDNLGRGPLYVERISASLNAQSGRVRRVVAGKRLCHSRRLAISPTDEFAARVTDRGLTAEPPRSVSVQIRLSDTTDQVFRRTCRVKLGPSRTTYVRFPFCGKWFTANARAEHHCLGGQFGFDFMHEQDVALHDGPPNRELACREFASFGQPLLAPADGIVVGCENAQPDLVATPGGASFAEKRPDCPEHLLGNYVIVATGGGRYLLMAHLRQGSVRVKPGETVQAGHHLAEVGNSGNTSGPHCHIEILDSLPVPSLLGTQTFNASGMPFGFREVVRERSGQHKSLRRTVPRQGDVLSSAG